MMFFEETKDILEIASKCGTSIFVVPKTQQVKIKNAIVLKPEEKTVITIDQVKSILDRLSIKQTSDLYIVIRPAELLQPEAANALLKNLEEPGDKVHFVLVTDTPSQLLPTILSRASLYILREKNWGDVIASDKIKDLAKRLMTTRGEELVDIAEEITKKKEGVRAYAMEIVGTAIEMTYKSYFINGKKVFLDKLPKLLGAYEAIARKGHVKLQIVANLC